MAKIIGLGSWFPNKVRVNSDWDAATVQSWEKHNQRALADATKVDQTAVLDSWTTKGFQAEAGDPFVGTVERRVVDDGVKAWDAETEAAKVAIEQAGIDPQLIDVVLSYSFVPDMACGNGAAMVMNNLGLKNAYAIGVDSMCSAAISHLALAKSLINSGDADYVLLTQSNFMTRGIPFGHPSSPSIGDAATAILVGHDGLDGHRILSVYSRTVRDQYEAVVWRRKENQNWWEPGESFYLGSFDPQKAKELVQQTLPIAADTTKSALDQIGMLEDDLDFFVSVQPRKWIPAGIAEMLGMKADQTIETFEKYAHLGCCGPIVNLIEAEQQEKLFEGDIVGVYAQGAGFTRATAIIKW
jgi:3-oxoacyl-[acyl-carrier-protein] synthase-3